MIDSAGFSADYAHLGPWAVLSGLCASPRFAHSAAEPTGTFNSFTEGHTNTSVLCCHG